MSDVTAGAPDRAHATDLRRILLAAAAVAIADWATKLATVTWLADDPLDLGWVAFRLHRNPGISFGLGNDQPFAVVATVTGGVVLLIAYLAWRGALHPPLAGGLMLGGGVGNLVDRLVNGSVVDMIDLGWWPTFNVADIALNVGVGIILLWAFLHHEPERADVSSDTAVKSDATVTDRATGGAERD